VLQDAGQQLDRDQQCDGRLSGDDSADGGWSALAMFATKLAAVPMTKAAQGNYLHWRLARRSASRTKEATRLRWVARAADVRPILGQGLVRAAAGSGPPVAVARSRICSAARSSVLVLLGERLGAG